LQNSSEPFKAGVGSEEEFLVEVGMPKHRVRRECVLDALNRGGNSVDVPVAPLDFEEGVQRGNQLGELGNPSPIELAESNELPGISGALDFGIDDFVNVVDVGFNSFAADLEAQVVENTEAEGALGDGECHTIVLNAVHHQSKAAKVLLERASSETDNVVDVAHDDLVFESNKHLVHEVTEVGSTVSPSVGNTFPSKQSECSDEGEIVSVLGVDKHTQVAAADVER
jgi:hypothetical protein